MNLKTVDIYYFSGTGNTLLVVKKMRDVFVEKGTEVNLLKIEKSSPEDVNLEHTIGLGFPVAGFSTYPFVWEFIESLPQTKGTKIFMVDTLGGFSGGIVGPLREKLKKKGYKPIGAREIIMPPNIFYIQDDETCKKKIEKGLEKAQKYALEIANGTSSWGRTPVLSDIMYYISKGLIGSWKWRSQHKWFGFKADKSKCNQCGICVDICPLNNIEMKDHPVHGYDCEFCMRCVSFCPRNATPCKFNYKGKAYRALRANAFLNDE
ncbi:MAG: 4Fe-4S ferredoxin [Euryarchaeota archaeon]|nr:4Fe-4S ferredoxin [Euryarchaeota archaeon]